MKMTRWGIVSGLVALVASGVAGGVAVGYFQGEDPSLMRLREQVDTLAELNRRQDKTLQKLRRTSANIHDDSSWKDDICQRLEMIEQEQMKLSLLVGRFLPGSLAESSGGTNQTIPDGESAVSPDELSSRVENVLDHRNKKAYLQGNNVAGYLAGSEKIMRWISEDLELDDGQQEKLFSVVKEWRDAWLTEFTALSEEVYGSPPDDKNPEKQKRYREREEKLHERLTAELNAQIRQVLRSTQYQTYLESGWNVTRWGRKQTPWYILIQ